MLPETPYVLLHAITTSGITHRNGAIKHIFYESDPQEDRPTDYSLFILSLMLAVS